MFVAGRNQNSVDHSVFLGPGRQHAPTIKCAGEDDSDVLIVGLGNDLPATTFPFADTRTFHVLTARYDGSKLTMSRNGESVGSARFTTSGPWQIGQVGGWFSSDFMIGDLAEILVYDRALSDSDTRAHQFILAEQIRACAERMVILAQGEPPHMALNKPRESMGLARYQ